MTAANMALDEDAAVSNFRSYLRINTAHPDPDYGELQANSVNTAFNAAVTVLHD